MTGLLNRRRFMTEIPRRFGARPRAPRPSGLFDLDNFKPVNDQVTSAATTRSARGPRPAGLGPGEDLVARLGGDEFAVWLEGIERPPSRPRPIC